MTISFLDDGGDVVIVMVMMVTVKAVMMVMVKVVVWPHSDTQKELSTLGVPSGPMKLP